MLNKKLIKQTIVEMIRDNELAIEVNIYEGDYRTTLETTVLYHNSEDYNPFHSEEIQSRKQIIKTKHC